MRSLARLCIVISLICATSAAHAEVRWQTDLEAAKRTAAQTNKLVLVHFWASWCKPCMRLESTVFNQPGLGEALEKDFVLVKVNIDHRPTTARKYGVQSIPADAVIRPDGQLVEKSSSPRTASAYYGRMQQIALKVPNRGLQAYANLGTQPGATPAVTPVTQPVTAPKAAPPATTAPGGVYGQFPSQDTQAPLREQLAKQATAQTPTGQYGEPAAGATTPPASGSKYSDYGGSSAPLASGPAAFGAPPAKEPAAQTPPFQQPNPPIASQTPSNITPRQNPAPTTQPEPGQQQTPNFSPTCDRYAAARRPAPLGPRSLLPRDAQREEEVGARRPPLGRRAPRPRLSVHQ